MPRPDNKLAGRDPNLTREQVKEIQVRNQSGEGQRKLAKDLKLSKGLIGDIISGRYELAKWGEIL